MNDIQMIKEEINLTFFVDDMILRVENLKESIKKKFPSSTFPIWLIQINSTWKMGMATQLINRDWVRDSFDPGLSESLQANQWPSWGPGSLTVMWDQGIQEWNLDAIWQQNI